MEPEILWRPPANVHDRSYVGAYLSWLGERGLTFEDYEALREWSVSDLRGFWRSLWEFFDVRASEPFDEVLTDDPMPDTKWFTGAKLNYAEHALAHSGSGTALLGRSQTRGPDEMSFDELREAVARARTGLVRLGVTRDDVVAAFLPNISECVVVFLAAASIGATFASCSPEFGVRSVLHRFGRLRPKVLFAADGYRYHGKAVEKYDAVATLRAELPGLEATVSVPYLRNEPVEGCVSWSDFMSEVGPLEFEQVDVDHPLYVLFSSGTTGEPKAIVHGHGRIVLEHLKVHALHLDLGPDDCLLAPATTSWMVWNFGVSALMRGTSLVCFDGDPLWPTDAELWRLAEETEATTVNCGALILVRGMKSGLRPGDDHDLSCLRAIGSTGSPLPAEAFRWVYEAVKDDVLLSSGSGGTDVCTGFVGGSPLLPVTAGEMACRFLGAPVESFGPDGAPVRNEPGELVITAPMPSMPVEFWGDPGKAIYKESYFDLFPGVWRHGDWITITDRGSCVISGRSDATLNRGGIRIGTAEFYSVVEALPEIGDSVAVHLEDQQGEAGTLILLVAPADGVSSATLETEQVKKHIRSELSPRHVPDEVHVVSGLPRTLTGKKLEVPIKKILNGADASNTISVDAVTHPEGVRELATLAERRRTQAMDGEVRERT